MEGLGIFGDLPQLDPLPAVGSNHAQALHIRDRFDIVGDLPQLDPLPAVKNCSSTALPAVGGKHAEEDWQQADLFGGLPSLPPFSCSCSDSSHLEPAVGGKSKRKREVLMEQAQRLASKSIPWRSLPYLREAALADVRVVAKTLWWRCVGHLARRVLLELERSARAIGEHSHQPLAALFEQAG